MALPIQSHAHAGEKKRLPHVHTERTDRLLVMEILPQIELDNKKKKSCYADLSRVWSTYVASESIASGATPIADDTRGEGVEDGVV